MSPSLDREFWERHLRELCDRLRAATQDSLRSAGGSGDLSRPVSMGAGDRTFGLDVPAEEVCSAWLEEMARQTPLSLLTEDAGWRHRGPDSSAERESMELPDFAHGGPRIALDPIDGTRNLMVDLRSAWTIVALAPPGNSIPTLKEVEFGMTSELPHTGMDRFRSLVAWKGAGCQRETCSLETGKLLESKRLKCDEDDRCDHGYFPFFRYERSQAQDLTKIECEFTRLLAAHEGADLLSCYDDQYISNGGQFVLLGEGIYRFVADLRAWLAEVRGVSATSSKPYDSAGAVLCAREIGAVVEAPDGSELDYPLDTSTPVSFVGFTNRRTRERLRSHLNAALRLSAESD